MLTAAISGSSSHHRDTGAGKSHFGILILVCKCQDVILCCCVVVKLCPTLCYPRNCNTPGSSAAISPGVCTNWCPLNWWCCLTTSSSATPFSFSLQSFPASGYFPMNWLFIRWPKYMTLSTSQSVFQHSQATHSPFHEQIPCFSTPGSPSKLEMWSCPPEFKWPGITQVNGLALDPESQFTYLWEGDQSRAPWDMVPLINGLTPGPGLLCPHM